ncbi:MAG: LamG domain-containing protein [Sedimentisphaerales bacterium]
MCRKLIFVITLFLVLGMVSTNVAHAGKAKLIGWWKFDEGTGTIASDSSGLGNDGTLGGNPTWIAGRFGSALDLDGTGDYVAIDGIVDDLTSDDITINVWVKTSTNEEGNVFASNSGGSHVLQFGVDNGTIWVDDGPDYEFDPSINDNQWHMITFTREDGIGRLYTDGVEVGMISSTASVLNETRWSIGQEWDSSDSSSPSDEYDGAVDDARFYDGVLSAEHILGLFNGIEPVFIDATDPEPADGSIYPDTWASLAWEPGDTAASHDVYLGENFADVNDGTGDTFRGNQVAEFYIIGFFGVPYPDGLVPGTTYYWRIDEIEADGTTKHKGDVWSFTVPSKTAYNPLPSDGMKFQAPDATMSWATGFGAKVHYVYFGTTFDEVNDAAGATPQAATTYDPGPLVENATYYWRVDEFDGLATYKGDVWSFKTRPVITITDPDLIGWWKFDEGFGDTALDWSGYENHATFGGDPQWVEGIMDGALDLDGMGDYVSIDGVVDDLTSNDFTLSAWVRTTQTGEGNVFASNDSSSGHVLLFGVDNGNIYVDDGPSTDWPPAVNDDQWHMITFVKDGSRITMYTDAVQVGTLSTNIDVTTETRWSIGQEWDSSTPSDFYVGMVDDVRFYNKPLTQAEVAELTRGDPLAAWNPNPGNNATVDVEGAKQPLNWSPGDQASGHDVYFGMDLAAVENADNSDTTGVYRGQQAGTSYSTTESLDWGTGPYYWRIDEINADTTITMGGVWSFMVADHLIVEDFESYDAEENQLWFSWHDGLGYGAPGVPPYFAGNGTGAAVGDENTSSYTEQTIVHGGGKSMPISYDNNKQGFARYSETEFTLTAPRDWTNYDVGELSIWFRGYPASVGSFVEGPVGTYTMTASGVDIWDQADEFHFGYKMLTGAGSIIARVESVDNTDVWAKAGVMIRESLEPGSKYAFACITPASGVSFQYRLDTDIDAASTTEADITAPYWVKLERSISGNFTGSISTNGTTWVPVASSIPQNISMNANVYVGLALTSHNDALTCTAKFSNVQIVGTVGPMWTNQDIGIATNAAEPLYVAISNTSGTAAVVVHDDPAASQIATWTEWVIPLQAFADQGINLTNVDRIAIGIGTKGNMTVLGGAGKMFIDDIGLYRTRTAP